ncbi:MAG: homocysteine S-methyltransferase family protein [Spirochaetes bacterium]|nr:homocysteine S-methyltransferase family protein [Spirochaetota bacterium]
MNKKEFKKLITEKIVLLDGATGTELQKRGLPSGACPEKWVSENPDVLIDLHQKYAQAGSDIIYTCTFGANYFKLKEFDLEKEEGALNRELVTISRKAVGTNCLLAGDISSTGRFIKPFGDEDFETIVDVYKQQVRSLLEGGVDLFVIETIMDLQEARAALIAVKEVSELPVLVSLTYTKEGKTLSGTDPVTAVITLQSLGADAVGVNCSTGPRDMSLIVKAMKPYARVPVFAKPNAGLPGLKDGKTVFDMTAGSFADFSDELIQAGVNLIGGCCGTSPEYIQLLKKKIDKKKGQRPLIDSISAVTSSRRTEILERGKGLVVVGERINPTGKRSLQDDLKDGTFDEVKNLALEQKKEGAAILDVNVGMPGVDEKKTLFDVTQLLLRVTDLPLCFDSSDTRALEKVLRIYPGRALINSVSGETHKLDELLPVAAKYGAMFILLPLDDKNIPRTSVERKKIVEKVFKRAKNHGYTKEDIIVDGLVMAISSNPKAAIETLDFIGWCTKQFKARTIVGCSNVSYGLPARELINSSFLSLAVKKGLTLAIANPSHVAFKTSKLALDLIRGKDKQGKAYIKHFSHSETKPLKKDIKKKDVSRVLFDQVVEGDSQHIVSTVKKVLQEKKSPNNILEDILIPAIQKVGEKYEKKEYFLPQIISGAEAMKKAVDHLTPYLKKTPVSKNKKIVILATVKGDIHDIGKNLVALMLKNYGFDIIDLGKNVKAETIIKKAKEKKAHIIGLSALMTTTMPQMKHVIEQAKKQGLRAKFIIGGAVVTPDYARQIGSSYASDSVQAVKVVKKL